MEKKTIVLVDNSPIKFRDYISSHPHTYDGVDLTQAEIDFINNEFMDYELKPEDFQTHFLQKIRMYIAQYKNMKAIEFCTQIFDITTDHNIRNIVQNTTNELQSTAQNNGSTDNTHQDTNSGNSNDKSGVRQLPMRTSGESEFEDLFDWSQGGSQINESKNTNGSTNNGSYKITTEDKNLLSNLGKGHYAQDNEFTEVGDQAVNCVRRIWNYILEPKALEWFCYKLQDCFILCW